MNGIGRSIRPTVFQQEIDGAVVAQKDHDRIGANDLPDPEWDQQKQQKNHLVLALDVLR